MKFSFVVPVLNEGERLGLFLADLRERFPGAEFLVVDGGSDDGSVEAAFGKAHTILLGPRGRAAQMNLGAGAAGGEWLCFLHADTWPQFHEVALQEALAKDCDWTFCRIALEGDSPGLGLVSFFMNWRSGFTSVATGDQMLIVRRSVFESMGGFADVPLMEDVEICKRLRKRASPLRPTLTVRSSGRRWDEQGLTRTILRMWLLRLAFWLGVPPSRLWSHYYGQNKLDAARGEGARVSARVPRLFQQFARFPELGQVKTRLQPFLDARQACAAHEALMTHTMDSLITSGLAPVELWLDRIGEHATITLMLDAGSEGPLQQADGDLGLRMYSALEHGLTRAVSVVLVGSDCPGLDAEYLAAAFDALNEADVVLGPAEDGGFVLIGARRVVPGMLNDVVWGQGAVLSSTLERLEQSALETVLLESRYDVDRPEDFRRWRDMPAP